MKYLIITILAIALTSCSQKVSFTNQIKEEFGLDNEKQLKRVQFYISQTITLQREKQSSSQGSTEGGVLISSSNKQEDRIVIQAQTPAIFEEYSKTGEMLIRFETGAGRYLTFNVRQDNPTAKFYLVANWDMNRGGEIMYGNQKYTVTSAAGNAYLMVKLKKLQKTYRQDRVVKGMKVG